MYVCIEIYTHIGCKPKPSNKDALKPLNNPSTVRHHSLSRKPAIFTQPDTCKVAMI